MSIRNYIDLIEGKDVIIEKAPPGKKAKDFIEKAAPDFKKRYGDNWEAALYATANKLFAKHHKKS